MNSSLSSTKATNAGFTLIELMVTIAVMAIIVSIAAPSISTQLANQRVKSTTATLENALKEAKIESVIRRQPLTLNYNNSDKTINIQYVVAGVVESTVASYKYEAKSNIQSGANSIQLKPSKNADEMTYNICDSNTSASPRQVVLSAVANISSNLGGNCS